jgi:cell division protein FtsL
MVDIAPGMEARNYGLKKTPNLRSLVESLKIFLPLIMIAGALSFYIWIYGEITFVGYQSQHLNKQEKEAQQIQEQLVLEEQTQINPERLEAIAFNNLGMVRLKANQIITSPAMDQNTGSSNALALGLPSHLPDAAN